MKKGVVKFIIGCLGLLGILMCGGSVIAWSMHLGEIRNYIGAVLIAFLCGCAVLCCQDYMDKGRDEYNG